MDTEVSNYDPDTGITSNEDEDARDPILDVAASNLISYACAIKETYVPGRHHQLIARELMKVMTGETKRLMIFAPPQHGKSELATQIFPSYYFGHFPEQSIIVGAYAQDKADDFGRATKSYMGQEIYRYIFPATEISATSDSIRRFQTTKGGQYHAVGIGAGVTGRGANGLLLDDPYKNREEADSETRTETIINWWKSTFRTRLRGDGWIVVIQTRWTKRDLVQFLLDQEPSAPKYKWRIVSLKAVIEDEEDAKNDPLRRKIGEVLWPDVFPADVMAEMKVSVGPRDWNALYQQQPSDAQGEVLLRKNWNYWCRKACAAEHEHHPIPLDKIDGKMQVWDCSFKDLKTSDFVVGGVGYKVGPNLYLMDRVRKRATAKVTCDLIRETLNKWPDVRRIGIEDKANGSEVIATMKQEISGVIEIPANGSKDSRVASASVHQESGNVYLPYDAIWKEEFIEECAAYPFGKYDDQVDMICHMILQMLGNRLTGMLEWMKEQVEKVRGRAV